MRTYRLRKGFGKHVCKDGHVITQANPIYQTESNLAKAFPNRFEDITGMEMPEDHPWGVVVSKSFALSGEITGCVIWKKGRRYRIVVNGKPLDTGRLSTEDEVDDALKAELKAIRAGQKEDDEDDEEPDDEDDTVPPDEDADDEDEDDSDDDAMVKPPKAKAKASKGKDKKKKSK